MDGAVFIMGGGKISGNRATGSNAYGGAVSIRSTSSGGASSVFTMRGGEISGNTSADNGGGVFLYGDSTYPSKFTMSGGEISGNTTTAAYKDGGAVYVYSGAEFTMSGGKISGNTSVYDGGAVTVASGAEFTMNDGKISGNTANDAGGAVSLVSYGNGTSGTYQDGGVDTTNYWQ
jgi:hypothetical protein